MIEIGLQTKVVRGLNTSDARKLIKRTGKVKHFICHEHSRLCFLITADKALVQTTLQTFLLEPLEVPGNLWHRRVIKIRELIIQRKIQDMDALIRECGKGVKMLPVNLDWYV